MALVARRDDELQVEKQHALVALFDQVFEKGIVKFLVFYPIAVTGWIASVLAVIGWTTVAYVLVAAAVLYILVVVLWLTVTLRIQKKALSVTEARWRTDADDRRRLGGQLANHMRGLPDYYHVVSWHEFIHIRAGGDTTIDRTVEIIPGEHGIDLSFHSLSANVLGEHSDVSFSAFRRIALPDGTWRELPLDSIDVWEREGAQFTNFIVLDEHVEKGTAVFLRAKWEWARYSTELVEKGKESHAVRMSRRCDLYELELVVDRVGAVKSGALYADPDLSGAQSVRPTITTVSSSDQHRFTCSASGLKSGDIVGIKIRNK